MTFSNTRVSETDTETSEALGFIRQARERELAKDPVHYYKLTAPDGSAIGDVLECHESHAAQLNEQRIFFYLHSQRQREADRLAREAKRQNEARIERYLADAAEEVARKAVAQDIPLPNANASIRSELASRSHIRKPDTHVSNVSVEQESPVVWTPNDYLWTRTNNLSGVIATVEGTTRCKHD
jgi:secreted Zn-dependent insulinase-like peptidase